MEGKQSSPITSKYFKNLKAIGPKYTGKEVFL